MKETAIYPDKGTKRHHCEKRDTWPKVLKANSERFGARRTAVRSKHYGIWKPFTWEQYYLEVKHLALGLLSLGFNQDDNLFILGDNARERFSAALAVQAIHGVPVDADSECSPSEIKTIVLDAGTRFAVVEDQEQVDKLLLVHEETRMFSSIIYWNYKGLTHYDDPVLMGIRDVLDAGKGYEKEDPGRFDHDVESGKSDDVCTLIYTRKIAGVGSRKKQYTHRTMRDGVEALLKISPWQENDTFIPFPVPSGLTDQWLGIGCHLLTANTLNFAETLETHQRDVRETRPSILCYGFRSWEHQAAVVRKLISDAHILNRWAFRLLMPMGNRVAELRKQKKGISPVQRFLSFLADIIIMKPLRDRLGLSNARICYRMGSALSPETSLFYSALEVPLLGLHETAEGDAAVRGDSREPLPGTSPSVYPESESKKKFPGIDSAEGASS